MGNSVNTGYKGRLAFVQKHPFRVLLLAGIVILALIGASIYSVNAQRAATATVEPAPQTATVRQGSLVISASGSGTLAASKVLELSFSTGGQVTEVFVKPGDQVEAGTVLAKVDTRKALTSYIQAKNAYEELTSAAGIAAAEEQVAQAQSKLMSAKYQLEYLISPEVMYWETEIANDHQAIAEAQTRAEASPSDEEAQQALKKARDYLSFANDMLKNAWDLYYDEYVPETFRLAEDKNGNDYYIVPTDLEIRLARSAIEEAQKALADSQEYYAVLTGGPLPEEISSQALIQYLEAEQGLKDTHAALDGNTIVAPTAGTILSVDASLGNTVDTETVITMADLSQLQLNFYLDETDWNLAAVGDRAEVSFSALPNQTFSGHVSQLDAELYQSGNTSVVSGIVLLDSQPEGFTLPIRTSASLDIIHEQVENAMLVPVEALHEIAPGEYVVYLVENGTFTQRAVEVGLQDQLYAEVISGLQAGDVVSTGPVTTN